MTKAKVKWNIGQSVTYKNGEQIGLVVHSPKWIGTPTSHKFVYWLNDGHYSTEQVERGQVTAIGGIVYNYHSTMPIPPMVRFEGPNAVYQRVDGLTVLATSEGELGAVLPLSMFNRLVVAAEDTRAGLTGLLMLTGPKTGRMILVKTKTLKLAHGFTVSAFQEDDQA